MNRSLSTPVCLLGTFKAADNAQISADLQEMLKSPRSPQFFFVTWCEFSFIVILHVSATVGFGKIILKPSLVVFLCLSTVVLIAVVVLNVFTGASLCLCGCFCIFGGL